MFATVVIRTTQDHPQASAPGYARRHLWVIRNLDWNRYGTPTSTPGRTRVQDPGAKIWSPAEQK